MIDYLVQFTIEGEKDYMVVPVEDYGFDIFDINEVEEYALGYISGYLEVEMEDIHIFDVVRINKNVDIEDLLVDWDLQYK